MTYEGYLSVGGVEVVNTERARGYLLTSDCPSHVIVADVCEGLEFALASQPYIYANIETAPWYDRSLPSLSNRFFGVVGMRIDGVTDSTRSFSRAEGVTNGGTNGRPRKAMRELRITATLLADGADALDYGAQWMSSVFDGGCGTHGDACGMTDAEFLAACPPVKPESMLVEDYVLLIDTYRRFVHDVAITGPITVEDYNFAGRLVGRKVEFTISSERAWVYGKIKQLTLAPSLPTVMEDTPFNRVPYPSAELAAGSVTIATNLSTNPSLETNDTGWSGTHAVISGASPAAFLTSGRSTDVAAVGTSSYRRRLLGDGGTTPVAGAVSDISARQDVSIPAGSNRRISLNLWTACLILAGAGAGTAIQSLSVGYQFLNGAANVGSSVLFGTADPADFSGNAYSISGVAVPATATAVRIFAIARLTWTSSATAGQNSDIRLYADALQVSVP
ncbi:minor tail protein [Microbacterium phage Pepe25]|nr:minor tail protein [Microbacterium phage Pepe25]